MHETYTLGIDIGTSSLKSVLIDNEGIIREASTIPWKKYQHTADFSEQDPHEWIYLIKKNIHSYLDNGYTIVAIGLCFNCSTLVPIDLESNAPISNAIMWNDQRSQKTYEALVSLHKFPKKYIEANEPLIRFLHFQDRYSVHPSRMTFLEAATWILFQLTGNLVIPSSIYAGRWGIIRHQYAMNTLLSDYPNITKMLRAAVVKRVKWREKTGSYTFKHTNGSINIPIYTSGNDGMTSLMGTGYLLDYNSEFVVAGTSTFHLHSREDSTKNMESIPDLDILFGRKFFLEPLISRRISIDPTSSITQVCLIGGAARTLYKPTSKSLNVRYFDQYCGALGTASFAGIANGELPKSISSTSKKIAQNWQQ